MPGRARFDSSVRDPKAEREPIGERGREAEAGVWGGRGEGEGGREGEEREEEEEEGRGETTIDPI